MTKYNLGKFRFLERYIKNTFDFFGLDCLLIYEERHTKDIKGIFCYETDNMINMIITLMKKSPQLRKAIIEAANRFQGLSN